MWRQLTKEKEKKKRAFCCCRMQFGTWVALPKLGASKSSNCSYRRREKVAVLGDDQKRAEGGWTTWVCFETKKKATQGSSPEENLSLSFSLLYKSCYLSVWFLIVAVVQVVVRQPCAKVVQISPVVTPVGTHEWNSVGNFFLLANQMGKRPTCCHETNWNRIQTGYQRDMQQRAPSAPAAVSIPSCKLILQFPINEWTMKIHWQLFFFFFFGFFSSCFLP